MACSRRPLRGYEILDGIAFRPGCTTLNSRTKVHREVLDLCRPLIEDGPSDTLDFVHFSAKRWDTVSKLLWCVDVNLCSYILEENVHDTSPFIQQEYAQFNIGFSCVAYLNTSFNLLPNHSTDEQRATMIVSGYHGLQLYANKFWLDHLVSYCTILGKQRKQLPGDLLSQLSILLGFVKDTANVEPTADLFQLEGLDVFNQHPQIQTLLLKVTQFRRELETDDGHNKSDKTAMGRWSTAVNNIRVSN